MGYMTTTNGALAYNSTKSKVLNLFGAGGAFRNRSEVDCVNLFQDAYNENESLALKCLFYLRDILEGAGERRFFRVCYNWLALKHPAAAARNMKYVVALGRWDDLILTTIDTPIEKEMVDFVKSQLVKDMMSENPSLLAKWMPSINASSPKTKAAGRKLCKALGLTEKEYRKLLTGLRSRIGIVESRMAANKWYLIDPSKVPSVAGMKYSKAFHRHFPERYETFVKSEDVKINTKTLFPYDLMRKARAITGSRGWLERETYTCDNETERALIDKAWNALPDYLDGKDCDFLVVADTSGSMTCGGRGANIAPIDVACSLALYAAERQEGRFKNCYISFSSHPQLVEIKGKDTWEKMKNIWTTNLCENTNLVKTFDLILALLKADRSLKAPKKLVIISDMQIDGAKDTGAPWTTEMEKVRAKWRAAGIECPQLVYWNVNAAHTTFLEESGASFISGASAALFQQVVSGASGIELMLETLGKERYAGIR